MKRAILVAAGTAMGLFVAGAAVAQPADEHAAADALVQQLDQDAAHHAVTAETLDKAKNALERAVRLRAAGDETHAKAADGLALEWAQTARDLVKAADAEVAAADLRHKALDSREQLERSRGLVEEAIASIGRLRAELAQAEGTAKEDRTAVEIHDGDKPPPPKKKGAKKAAPAPAKPPKGDAGGTP